jgi:hypothetical protein
MKTINEMNQDELIVYARKLENGETGRTFDKAEKYWREQGNDEIADQFAGMTERWWELEKKYGPNNDWETCKVCLSKNENPNCECCIASKEMIDHV